MYLASPRRALSILAAGMLLTALPLPLLAQKGGSGGGAELLRMKFKMGEVDKYQTNMSITLAGAASKGSQGGAPPQQLSVIQQFKTSKLLPNGSAEVLVTTINMQGGAGMGSTSLPKPVTLIMDSRGAVTMKGAAGANLPSMFSSMLGSNALGTQQIPLPEKAVKPGDVWTNALPASTMGAGTVKGQYVKVETVGKHKTALLHFILTIPVKVMMDQNMQPTQSASAAAMTMSGTIVMNIDNDIELVAGRLIRSSGSGTMVMTITTKAATTAAASKSGAPAKPITMNTNLTLGTTLVEP